MMKTHDQSGFLCFPANESVLLYINSKPRLLKWHLVLCSSLRLDGRPCMNDALATTRFLTKRHSCALGLSISSSWQNTIGYIRSFRRQQRRCGNLVGRRRSDELFFLLLGAVTRWWRDRTSRRQGPDGRIQATDGGVLRSSRDWCENEETCGIYGRAKKLL